MEKKVRSPAGIRRDPSKISQRFESYLEQHRIFELFQELSAMLLIKKPDDHLLFLKQSIHHAARRLDAPRIIILAPPSIDRLGLAKDLATKFNIPLIRLRDFTDGSEFYLSDSTYLVEKLRAILIDNMTLELNGWIFLDFPRNDAEARCLQRIGIFPSHVLDLDLSGLAETDPRYHYTNEVRGLRRVFSKTITRVNMRERKIEDVFESCLMSLRRRQFPSAPRPMRILLIDPNDSERGRLLARHIAGSFNVSHIDFDRVLEMISLQDTKFAGWLSDIRQSTLCDHFLPSDVKIESLKQFLLQSPNMRRGWVMTGFPTNVNDFKHLDMTDYPPNRVIVIVTKDEYEFCHRAPDTDDDHVSEEKCSFAEKDHKCTSENDLDEILKYAGESGIVIEEHEEIDNIKGKIDSILMKPPPCVQPRISRLPPEIKPTEVEFDPDDEPSVNLLNCIRESEPLLPLI